MRRFLLLLALAVGGVAVAALRAQADPPDLLRQYRFLDAFSQLRATGGIAGIDVTYDVSGTFDLITGWEYRLDPPPLSLHAYARFDQVDAWASHPLLDGLPLNLDRVLNLTGLRGELLPVGAPFDVYEFTGKTEDGSAVRLLGRLLGQWLALDGQTTPPPGSADFLAYELRSWARLRPYADFDGDGSVGDRDFSVWEQHFGAVLPPASGSPWIWGDADEDGAVDGADLLLWQRQYGETPPVFVPLTASQAVPEPATLGWFGLGWLAYRGHVAPREKREAGSRQAAKSQRGR
jgi:hypothetical protein